MLLLVVVVLVVAYAATILGMSCWRQPLTRTVIIPSKQKPRQVTKRLFILTSLMVIVPVWSAKLPFARNLLGLDLSSGQEIAAAYIGAFFVLFPLVFIVPANVRATSWGTMALVAVSTSVLWVWVQYPNWIMYDIVAVIIACNLVVLTQSRMPYAWLAGLFLVGACLDAWMVYGSSDSAGTASRMLSEVAPPFVFLTPTELSLHPTVVGGLGMGDVHAIGLLVLTAFRMSVMTKIGGVRPFFISMIASVVALLVCDGVGRMFHHGQPALVFIVPMTCGAVFLDAWHRGYLDQLKVTLYPSRKQRAAQA